MKVAVVSTAKNRGGAAKIALTIANGIKNYFPLMNINFYHAEDNIKNDWIIGLKKPMSRECNAFLSRIGGSRLVIDQGVADRIVKDTRDADVLHIHNIHGYYLNYKKLLNNWMNRPVVWTWHDMWGATGRCSYSLNCDRWKFGCIECQHKDYYPKSWLNISSSEYNYKTNFFSKLKKLYIVTPSKWLADIAEFRNLTSNSVNIIPNPVNTTEYKIIAKYKAKVKLNLDVNKKYLLFIAADCNNINKGYADFLKIIENNRLNGIVVGIPPKARSERIVYAGPIKDTQLLSLYYSSADIMIITSKQDNYPNTVMESLSCGTPVMGYAVGGIPSQIPENWNGLVKINDVCGLTKKILDFFGNLDQNNRIDNMCRNHVKRIASLEIISQSYYDLYNKALS